MRPVREGRPEAGRARGRPGDGDGCLPVVGSMDRSGDVPTVVHAVVPTVIPTVIPTVVHAVVRSVALAWREGLGVGSDGPEAGKEGGATRRLVFNSREMLVAATRTRGSSTEGCV